MANTLKFGNGEWYGKKDTILAYNSENNNYKPLPFDFSRGSSATVVNKDGLIETVGSGEPRVDYKDNTKGALLLEPSRSNAITNSETFGSTGWGFVTTGTVIAPIVTNDYAISPDGTQNAQRIQFDLNGGTTSSDRTVIRQNIGAQNYWFLSVWMKSTNGAEQKILWHTNADSNETIVTGEWKRFTFSRNGVSNAWAGLGLRGGTSGVDTADILVYGFQAEQGSYATSYIPTSGGVVTRLREEANNQNNLMSGLTDMAMFVDYELPNGNSSGFRNQLGFRDDDNANFYMIQFPNSNTHEFRYTGVANVNVDMTPSMSEQDFGLRRKLLYTKTGTTLKVFCNGIQVSTVTSASATTFSTTSEILNVGENYDAEMKIKDWKLYNNGFTDAEAITLTTI
jgi:hypothetical protein